MRHTTKRKRPLRGGSTVLSPAPDETERLKSGFVCLFLVILVWLPYARILWHDFINYDDNEYVRANFHVLNGLNWADLKWAFTTGYGGNAHPLTWLTHQLDVQLHGTWAGGHHLTSLVLHTVNVVLLFLLFWRLLDQLWPSALIAALFGIHPLHVESVAWIAERKDVLSGMFFLLTLHAYAAYAAKPQVWRYTLSLGLFVLGILSKPVLVTVPCVLLLLDYWPLNRMTFSAGKHRSNGGFSLGRLILEKVPFVLVVAGWSWLTFILQKQAGAVAAEKYIGLGQRIANAIVSYALYIWNTIWPRDLALFYPYPRAISVAGVALSATLLVLVSALAIAKRKNLPYLLVGWLWFLGMLVPVIGLIQIGQQARADRYTYLPQIGLCVIISLGIAELVNKLRLGGKALSVSTAVGITGLTVLCYRQLSYWQNSETIWRHTLIVTSDNYVAHNNLGRELLDKGQAEDGIRHFRKAIEIYPSYSEGNNSLGVALAGQRDWEGAINSYRAAIRLQPNYPEAHFNVALSLTEVGKDEEALTEFGEALRLRPDFLKAHFYLASLLLRLERRDEAVAHFEECLRLNANDPEIKNILNQLRMEQ